MGESNGEFKDGDRVQVRAEILSGEEPVEMGPTVWIENGWPNEFEVIAVLEHKGEPHLALEQCCKKRINPATGQFRCFGHPARHFEKCRKPFKPAKNRPPDRYMLVDTPWGELVRLEYFEDDQSPGLQLKLGSGTRPVRMSGGLTRALGKLLKDNGWI